MSGNFILGDLHKSIKANLKNTDGATVEAAFIDWIIGEINYSNPPIIEPSILDYREIAQLSYLSSINKDLLGSYSQFIKDGILRTTGRNLKLIGGTPATFISDSVALLGLAVGANLVGQEYPELVLGWLETFIIEGSSNLEEWKRCIAFCALEILGSSKADKIDTTGEISDLRLALSLCGITAIEKTDDRNRALTDMINSSLDLQRMEVPVLGMKAKSLAFIIGNIQNLSLKTHTVEDLMQLLRRVPSGFRRWTFEESKRTTNSTIQRWDIQNEYHVQNFLYFLLSPIFPDIEDEFYSDQTAQINPRADLGVPSMQLIIEVKFLRSTTKFQKLVEEIAADNTLYFNSSGSYEKKYKQLLVFVWDDSVRTHEYDKFEQGINAMANVVGTIIMPRPGNMKFGPQA